MNKRRYPQATPPRTDQPERLVTDLELADRLSISRRHVHVLRSRGQLRAVRLGNAVRFPLNENLARVLDGVSAVDPKPATS